MQDNVSADASGTEVNGWAPVAVPAEESATSDELASQTYRGDGRQEGEKRQMWWPERKESSSPAVVEVGGDGGCRKQIVLLSWHVNPSSAPVQMEDGNVNSGYGGPKEPCPGHGRRRLVSVQRRATLPATLKTLPGGFGMTEGAGGALTRYDSLAGCC
ncbi:hypothetical protein BKA70DRAFT_85958 [Coprinopsis sp. MPI-PUGE-AT-0042]|nr:hypothetical protein BKA70DRAFT_85958 [Coprinopsis sp. MPI-PUGE-AT-0042]